MLIVVPILSAGVGHRSRVCRVGGRHQRIRPRLDLLRIAAQVTGAVVVVVLLGVRVPAATLVAVAVLGLWVGNLQGRNLDITDDEGRWYASRNTVAVAVWAAGLIAMQTVGVLRRGGRGRPAHASERVAVHRRGGCPATHHRPRRGGSGHASGGAGTRRRQRGPVSISR